MGNNLDLNKKIQYSTLQGHEFNFTIQDLKGHQNFPKLPSKEREIEKQFKNWLDKVQLDKKQKDQLRALPIKYKFRLCYRHDCKMKEFLIEDQKRIQIQKDISQILEKLQKQINHLNLQCIILSKQALLNNLMIQDYMSLKVEQILQNNFVSQLVMTLQQLEVNSRQSKNFRDQILIIRIFEQLLNSQLGVLAMCSVPQFFKVVFSAFHPIEPEISGLVLKVLGGKSGLCWQEGCEQKILDAMNDFKELYNLYNRFEILIKVIYLSRNLVQIYHLIKFLFNFLFSLDNSNHVIEELYETMINGRRIDEIFKQIKLRIKRNQQYQIENCTYDSVRKNLLKFEHPLVNNNTSTENLEFKSVTELNDESQFQSVTFIESEDHSFQDIVMDDRFYLESSDEQLFRGIGQQIMELMDGILNIDNFNTLIEQQELEALVEPQEFESNTFYMDQSIHFKQKSMDLSSHRIISQTNISNIDDQDQDHEIEIKLLEEKNQLIIKNYEEAQLQLESLKQELKQQKNQNDLNIIEFHNQEDKLQQLNTKLKLQEDEINSLKLELLQNQSQLEQLLNQPTKVESTVQESLTEQLIDEQVLIQQQLILQDSQKQNQQNQQQQILINVTQETQTHQKETNNIETQTAIISHDKEMQVDFQSNILQSEQPIKQQSFDCSQSQTEMPIINVSEVIKEYSDRSTLTDILQNQQQQTIEQSTQTEPTQQSSPQINIIPPPLPTSQPISNAPPPPPPPPPMKGAPPPPPIQGAPPPPPPPPPMKGAPPPPPIQGAPPPPPPPPPIKGAPPPPPIQGGPPPPPPPPMKGGPPPPPPMKGGPPPPPMNGGLNPQIGLPTINLPVTPVIVPSVAMKPLNWVVVQPQNLQNSIFKSLNGEQNLDINFLEKNFNKVVIDPKEREGKGSTVVIQKIQLISSEKQKNIELVLGKLKLPGTMIQKALIQIDQKILTPSTVDSLDAICPNEEDLKTIMEYSGAKELLGNAELFIDNLRQVNGFQFRLKSLKFLGQAYENQKELEQKIEQLQECFVSLQNLEEIKILFQTTLNIGNFLNATTPRGSAKGFKIDVIEKCGDIKTQDNQTNLLCYIIQECEKKLQKNLISEEQIIKFEVSSKVSINQLNTDLQDLKKGAISLVKAIESQSSDEQDLVTEKFTPKLEEINKIIAKLEESLKALEIEYVKCAQFYCENPKDSSDKFGDKLLRMFKVIMKWKNDMKQKEERKKRQEELAIKQQQKPQIAHPPKNPAQTSRMERPPEGKAVVNELMLQLQKRNNLQVNNKPSTFISNEINQLRQIKQQRGSFLQIQPPPK